MLITWDVDPDAWISLDKRQRALLTVEELCRELNIRHFVAAHVKSLVDSNPRHVPFVRSTMRIPHQELAGRYEGEFHRQPVRDLQGDGFGQARCLLAVHRFR